VERERFGHGGDEHIDRLLAEERPAPSDAFGEQFAGRMQRMKRHTGRTRPRTAMATIFCVVAFGVVAASGGVSYAVDGIDGAVTGGSTEQATSATVTPADVQYASGTCIEDVNPHGGTVPPAGQTPPGNGPGQNEDGFYQVGTSDGSEVIVTDLGSGTQFGPYPSGTVVKYTQATGATPSEKKIGSTDGQAGAVLVHITGTADFSVTPVGGGTSTTCLVPRPPK
jgi:hypothetical protein